MIKWVFSIIVGLFFSVVHADTAVKPLSSNNAFQLTAKYDHKTLILQWNIAPNYYLYRDKITIAPGSQNTVPLGDIVLPKGTIKSDKWHAQDFEVYNHTLTIAIPLKVEKGLLDLTIGYQGCGESGFCYPLIHKQLKVEMNEITPLTDLTAQMQTLKRSTLKNPPISQQASIEGLFDGHNIFFIIFSFMGLGLLLSFTPCVLPMVPILSGIIVGHGKHLGWKKTFLLSLSYVLGMAITYAIAGIFVALLGSSLQTQFQRPWVIVLFSGIFVLLGLSLFGLYELRLPNSWQRLLTKWSHRQKGGSYFSVFIMGSISSLIVSPCVTAPLIGVLSYIADSGNIWLGASALLALGLGMGIPLLLVGLSAGHILPKAGAWMGALEKIMGLTMFGLAIWILSRVIPGYIALLLWAILLMITAVFLGIFSSAKNDFQKLCRGLGLVFFIYGIILMIGAALGNTNLFRPWENWKIFSSEQEQSVTSPFIILHNMTELDAWLANAKANKKMVLLDFYADWCESCITLDKTVFNNKEVKTILSNMVVLRADITINNTFSQALLKRFHVIAPPTILLFDQQGREQNDNRLIGQISTEDLMNHIQKLHDYQQE